MKKFLYRAIIFIILLFGLNYAGAKYFDLVFPENYNNKFYWIFSKKNEHYDFAVAGSSRAFNVVDVKTLERKMNNRGINIGVGGSGLGDTYLILNKLIQNEVKIDHLVLHVDRTCLCDSTLSYPFHDYTFMPFLDDSTVGNVVLDHRPESFWYWDQFPFTKYMEFNERFPINNIFNPPSNIARYDTSNGSKLLYKASMEEFEAPKSRKYVVSESAKSYLNLIISLAQHSNIKLIFYSAPVMSELKGYYDTSNPDEYLRATSTEHNIPYLDFRSHALCDQEAFFADMGHLNGRGAIRFSSELADSLEVYIKAMP